MNAIDVAQYLEPVSAEAPSGENLEYDPSFVEIDKASKGKEAQEFGDTVIEGQEPDWREVEQLAMDLLPRTRDLRLAHYLMQLAVRTGTICTVRDVLALLQGWLENFWPTIHPQLDPDDDNDPTFRVNALATLCDGATVMLPLRKMPLVRSRSAGIFSRRDFALASGEIPTAEGEDRPDGAVMEGAFQELPLDQLKRDLDAATESVAAVRKIDSLMTDYVGSGNARNLTVLLKELDAIRKIFADQWKRRGGDAAVAASEAPAAVAEDSGDGAAPAASATVVRGAAFSWDMDITNRQDALKAIDKASKYFERFEPSSPVPLLLRRAKRLSNMNFLEILGDIAPDGVERAEQLGGTSRDEYLRDNSGE